MTHFFHIHPDDPQLRLIRQVVEIIHNGGVIVYPTDSAYAIGCQLGNKHALDRIRAIRNLPKSHNFTLMCSDLSELATYASVDNPTYRLLKANTPGPYTFVLPATREVPKRLQHPKRKTIGLRIPDNKITMGILAELHEPLMSVTLILPGDDLPLSDPEVIFESLEDKVELVVDGGFCGFEPTTVVDILDGVPEVVREGKGSIEPFK